MASNSQSDSSDDCRAFVLPVDVVIRSPEILAEQRDDPCSLIHKVLEEGKGLYERRVA